MSASIPTEGYGSVENIAAATTDRPFDVLHTYYLKDTAQSAMTRRRKCLLVILPTLLAIILMGGVTFWLLANFSRLYPTSQVDRSYDSSTPGEYRGIPIPTQTTTPVVVAIPSPVPMTTTTTTKESVPTTPTVAADCENNEKCQKLGLKGQCCPTLTGDTLLCCH